MKLSLSSSSLSSVIMVAVLLVMIIFTTISSSSSMMSSTTKSSSTTLLFMTVSAFQQQQQQQYYHQQQQQSGATAASKIRDTEVTHRPFFSQRLRTTKQMLLGSSSTSSSNKSSLTALSLSSSSYQSNNGDFDDEKEFTIGRMQERLKLGLITFVRVAVPAILAGIIAFFSFPVLSLWLVGVFSSGGTNAAGVLTVLSTDSSQFVQNFLSVASLLFSILVGQTYYFMYQQQEMVYYALFDEVTEAKSLLEQIALVSQGRTMYQRVLTCMSQYVQNDLKALDKDPAILLSSRPMDDPLETIMYLTSVGVPSTVYETVKSLRQARARRLGALQRKLPSIHMILLWTLAAMELISFPLLGAGTQTLGGYHVLTIEGVLFGVMTTGIVLTLRVVGELWRQSGGAYNVDSVLQVMVRGLEKELFARTNGLTIKAQKGNFPSTTNIG
mmetsp:Transcript_60015/g.67142  ORF Transcript_60015/g.67142 Transcript_60015/m.67142 type:complete len:441 (-) Transcript_60015:205-1527(-)